MHYAVERAIKKYDMKNAEDFPLGGVLGVLLVYVAAVLFYKPIFTQPLGVVFCAAGAVEKSATERAVRVSVSQQRLDGAKIRNTSRKILKKLGVVHQMPESSF